jgi:hypothetical protein
LAFDDFVKRFRSQAWALALAFLPK